MLLILLAVTIVVPFYMVILSSFTKETDLVKHGGMLFIPQSITLEAYKTVFNENRIITAFKNSLFITLTGTFFHVLITSMLAYPLSKKLRYGKVIGFLIYFTMLFNGGLIPTFLLLKRINLLNTLWVIIVVGLVSPYHMILLRNFFAEIPGEIEESALIDGAGRFKILFKMIFPLSLPAIATIGLFTMVFYWNNWLNAVFFIPDKSKWPLPTILMLMLQNSLRTQTPEDIVSIEDMASVPAESLKYATLMVTTVPIMLVYPFLQKYFAKGIIIGAVKG